MCESVCECKYLRRPTKGLQCALSVNQKTLAADKRGELQQAGYTQHKQRHGKE